MASKPKKMLLCCVLFLILSVMGAEDSKEVGDRVRKEEGVREERGEWVASHGGRSGDTEAREESRGGEGERRKITEAREEETGYGGDLIEPKGRGGGSREDGKRWGGRWEGVNERGKGKITGEIESEVNGYTTSVGNEGEKRGKRNGEILGGRSEDGGCGAGCEAMERETEPEEREEGDIPQTRNPTETNSRIRKGIELSEKEITRQAGEGGVGEIGRERNSREEGESEEERGGTSGEEGREDKTESKRWKHLSRNESNSAAEEEEEGRLKKELRAAKKEERNERREREGETSGRNPQEREESDVEKELVMQREEGKRRGAEEEREGSIGTNREEEFLLRGDGEEETIGKPPRVEREGGEMCGYARCTGREGKKEGTSETGREIGGKGESYEEGAHRRNGREGEGQHRVGKEWEVARGEEERGEARKREEGANRETTKDKHERELEERARFVGGNWEGAEGENPKIKERAEKGDDAKRLGVGAERASTRGETRSDGSVTNLQRDSARIGVEEEIHAETRVNVGKEQTPSFDGKKKKQLGNEFQAQREGEEENQKNRRAKEVDSEKEMKRNRREDELEAELRTAEAGVGKYVGSEKIRERADVGGGKGCCEDVDVDASEGEKDSGRGHRRRARGGEGREENSGESRRDSDVKGGARRRQGSSDKEAPEVDSELEEGLRKKDVNREQPEDQKGVEERFGRMEGEGAERWDRGNVGRDVAFPEKPEGAGIRTTEARTLGVETRVGKMLLGSGYDARVKPSSSLLMGMGETMVGSGVDCCEEDGVKRSGEETMQEERMTRIGVASYVTDDGSEIEFPSLMDAESRRRVKGDEGEAWTEGRGETGARGKGRAVNWAPWKAGSALLQRAGRAMDSERNKSFPSEKFDVEIPIETSGIRNKGSDAILPYHKDEMELANIPVLNESDGSMYERQIESLKSSNKAEIHDSLVSDKSSEEAITADAYHQKYTRDKGMGSPGGGVAIGMFQATDTGGKDAKHGYESITAAKSEDEAPVVVSEGETDSEEELIEETIHPGTLSYPKAIGDSMLPRIPAVNANLNDRAESNANHLLEATAASPIMWGGREIERKEVGERTSESRKGGTLEGEEKGGNGFDLRVEGIKGPRRMLMSVSGEPEGMKGMEEDAEEQEERGDALSKEVEDNLRFGLDGRYPSRGQKGKISDHKRDIHQPGSTEKGVKFVTRSGAESDDKGTVYASNVTGTSVVGKSIGNTSLTAPSLIVNEARIRAKNRGIVLGDKIYHWGKGGLVAVSIIGTPTKASVRHVSLEKSSFDEITKTGHSAKRDYKEIKSKGEDDVKSKTAKGSVKGSDKGQPERRVRKGQYRSSLEEHSPRLRDSSRSEKKSTMATLGDGRYALSRTTVSTGDHGSLESPPTLPTEEKEALTGTSQGDVPTDDRPKFGTTTATPAEEEAGLSKWKSNPIEMADSAARQLPFGASLGCERGSEGVGGEYPVSERRSCAEKGRDAEEDGGQEEHLGYTRLQVRKPRMLDASGFGRGRGSGVGGSILTSHSSGSGKKSTLTVGMILPHIAFGQREYTRSINTAITGLQKSKVRKLDFLKKYTFSPQQVRSVMMQLTPSPTAILNSLCKEFLSVNVSAILYLMNYEKYGRSTASAQYFLQLAGYLGIPVIAWNADNSGLERRASQSSLQLQLAPSLEHQTAAMLSILERYKWHQFSIVTSQIAGHDDFVQAVRERILDMQDVFKFTILNAVLVTKPSDLSELVNSESRVVLLYCTREEALKILSAAADYKITGENYVWVAAQSVIENRQPMPQFPIGMLGVHFDTSMSSLVTEIATAVKVYAYGVEDFVNDPRNEKLSLNTQLSCEGVGDSRWKVGDRFFKYLRNVSVEGEHGKPNIEFTADGVLKAAELKIMNLRPGVSKQLVWEEIGVWKSWEREGLDIKDIVWPGGSHTPPQGVPEKFHMRITFLEEPPYINVAPPDPITGKCSINRGVLCRFAAEMDMSGIFERRITADYGFFAVHQPFHGLRRYLDYLSDSAMRLDVQQAHRNASYYQCCSGFCIDLLEKFSEELGFTYELVRVEDGKWGTLENGKWNGLIADLINRKTDMVMTSLMINSDREAVVDFTVPFMESGIAIVVAKRTGIISPTAFLEPFDTASWMLVGFVAIQVSAFTIFLFEWLSPSGFNMKVAPSTNHRFSLFRTYWLVWAVLFQAAVHVDCPKGFTARFMTNVWAMFAVVFLAIYTANLAAFMITREEFHEFSGIDDHRLAKPFSHKPMFKFGTIPWGHTDSTLKKYFREMHAYMKRHNRSIVGEGIEAVLSGELDAFIYDGTVLDYLVSQDEDCRLLTVGSWYAMTGYGLAFQRNSKYVRMFNQRLLDFRENGDLERLRRYWMTGSCKPGKQERKSSDPLALEQFLSAFLLLMSGILLAAFLLLLEHLYFKYVRHHLARTDRGGCCALVSLSMGKSLTFRGAVYEAQDMYRNNRPRGPPQHQHTGGHRAFTGGGRNCNCSYCEGLHTLWATRRELETCRLRIRHLEKQMEAHGIRPLPPPPPQSLPSLLPPPGSSPGNRRYLNDEDALRTRDMTRNHVTSTEYCGQLYRPCRTEIAEMETVL